MPALARVVHLPVVTRVLSRVPVIRTKLVSKAVRCHFNAVCLPKFGFKNHFRVEYKAVNLSVIDEVAVAAGLDKVTVADLLAAGKVRKNQLVKVLGVGTLSKKIDVAANAFSRSAEEAIVAAGGTVEKI